MSGSTTQEIARMLQGMIVERQRLLIREANYLRGLVGLPPVRAERERSSETAGAEAADGHAASRSDAARS